MRTVSRLLAQNFSTLIRRTAAKKAIGKSPLAAEPINTNITSSMPEKQPAADNSVPSRPWLTPQDQRSLHGLITIAVVMTVGYWWYHGGHRGRLVEIERASPLQARFLVDINRAESPELIQLPNLGETLAQRVLLERQQNGPFRSVDDLVRVHGIGVKTLERIRPYLLPISADSDSTTDAAAIPGNSAAAQNW